MTAEGRYVADRLTATTWAIVWQKIRQRTSYTIRGRASWVMDRREIARARGRIQDHVLCLREKEVMNGTA